MALSDKVVEHLRVNSGQLYSQWLATIQGIANMNEMDKLSTVADIMDHLDLQWKVTMADSNGQTLNKKAIVKWIKYMVFDISHVHIHHSCSLLSHCNLFIGIIFGMENTMKQW